MADGLISQKTKLIEAFKKSIVLIDTQQRQADGTVRVSVKGTGFVVSSNGIVVSCYHVFNEIPEEEKKFLGVGVLEKTDQRGIDFYARYPLKFLQADTKNDIAVFKTLTGSTKTIKWQPIKIGNSYNAHEGEDVIFTGFPKAVEFIKMKIGITLATTSCIIGSVKKRGIDGSIDFFMLDTHINPGYSGSPLIKAEDGEVIGIIAATLHDKVKLPNDGPELKIPTNIGIARPINSLSDLVRQVKKSEKIIEKGGE